VRIALRPLAGDKPILYQNSEAPAARWGFFHGWRRETPSIFNCQNPYISV